MKEVSEIRLKGKIIGFEEFSEYVLEAPFGEHSPFRVLNCVSAPISFVVINPYYVLEDYAFDIDDATAEELLGKSKSEEGIAVLCIVRPNDRTLYVNLRSPIIINTKKGKFIQIILQSEGYGVSVPFAIKKEE
ncbi:MAG TPA: flagellar assembly protein FliW [Syntrophorhabdaceae bacterium]|mgnify:CR=1 FL=1|nr:flagellar assembly protein FliW [Syntrophorhabdaceae bacterium]